jgi:hypothetical protein
MTLSCTEKRAGEVLRLSPFPEIPMSELDLAGEMAAARKRSTERTAKAIRESRVLAVRTAARPGSTPLEIEELVRSLYPRLAPEMREEVTGLVCEMQRGGSPRVQPQPQPQEELPTP